METSRFYDLLKAEIESYKDSLETVGGDWIVKGFIDVNHNVYTITNDTKVVSKIIEILLIPKLSMFAERNGLELELPSAQNYYPDLTFIDHSDDTMFAVDFKSSFYDGNTINGLTLGSYWGYFRNRDIRMNMDHTYNSYSEHFVLGMLYKQSVIAADEKKVYSIDELSAIHSVIEQFIFFLQPKWKIAIDRPGSGNTRNMGGESHIDKLINGTGLFTQFRNGKEVFDDYWMNYFNKTDARNEGIGQPKYNNIRTYIEYLNNQNNIFAQMHEEV